jgi:hypothetical protein
MIRIARADIPVGVRHGIIAVPNEQTGIAAVVQVAAE